MAYQTRSDTFTLYRAFFIGLFLMLGIIGIGSVLLENYTDLNVFFAASDFDNQALQATFIIMGILGFCTALMMIYLIKERRSGKFDRRIQFQPLDFPDRRSNTSRRENNIDRRANRRSADPLS